ncbi:hypothetical protein LMG31841_00245 [Paraburkholderia saeva]|uniref:Uncharacterized protein n=1 Tax=Paraburkholderia saeva TaxID=2777537 RepID=A0A9N8WZM8_9BURK|nr:hypothetical protein LMG31841_00245 [Paraburkholderia saeva]
MTRNERSVALLFFTGLVGAGSVLAQSPVQVTSSQQYIPQNQFWQVNIESVTPRVLNCTISWTANQSYFFEAGNATNGNAGLLVPAYPGFGGAMNSHWESPKGLVNFNHTLLCH